MTESVLHEEVAGTRRAVHDLLFARARPEPGWSEAFDWLLAGQGISIERLLDLVADAYRADSGLRDGYARIGYALLLRRDLDAAEALFRRDWTAGRMSWWQAVRFAETLARLGRVGEAERIVRRLYGADPNARNGYSAVALALEEQGRRAEALRLYDRDRAEERQTPGCALNRAVLLARVGHTEAALAAVAEAYRGAEAPADGFSRIAEVLEGLDRLDEAAACYGRDIELRRQTLPRLLRYVHVLGRMGRLDAGERAVRAARETNPEWCGIAAAFADGVCCRAFSLPESEPACVLDSSIEVCLRLLDGEIARKRATPESLALRERLLAFRADIDACRRFEADSGPVSVPAGVHGVARFSGLIRSRPADEAGRRHPGKPGTALLDQYLACRFGLHLTQAHARFPHVGREALENGIEAAFEIERRIRGRHCGDLGDKLSQYASIVEYAATNERSALDSIEIGTLFGGSCLMKLAAVRRLGRAGRVVCIDPMTGYYGAQDAVSGVPVCPATLYKNLRAFGFPDGAVELRPALSGAPEAVAGLAEGAYATLMIDADHSYAAVRRDWERYGRFVAAGGFVLFDDFEDAQWPGVTAAVRSIVATLPGDWRALGSVGTTYVLRRLG